MDFEKLFDDALKTSQELVTEFGWKILGAIAIFIVGKWIAGLLTKLFKKTLGARNVDATIIGFLGNLIYMGLLAGVILAALGALSVETASFITIVGAAGLAIGLALQGSLSNFAAGVLLVFFRPYRVGDLVEVAGQLGVVKDVQIFCTIMTTPQNVTIIVPNAAAGGGVIKNYSTAGTIRVDMTFGIGYDADIRQAKGIIEGIVSKDERVLSDPAPTVAVVEHGADSVNIACNVWMDPANKWGVWFDTHEAVKYALDEAGIGIPYPQRDVHLYKHDAA